MTQPASGAVVELSVKAGTPVTALAAQYQAKVIRAVVDTHLHLPGMFEIVFDDSDGGVAQGTGLEVGKDLQVMVGTDGGSPRCLITGEITSLEADYHPGRSHLIVRGYDKGHRLQRVRKTKTFLNATDSDIARRVASDAGLTIGHIEATQVTHVHLSQVDETDWDFLRARAEEIGYEFGTNDGQFFFRRATGTAAAGTPIELTLRRNLGTFRPRVSAGNLPAEVEVRVWDPNAASTVAVRSDVTGTNAGLTGITPANMGRGFMPTAAAPPPPPPPRPGVGNLGPAPSEQAIVVTERPVAIGSNTNSAASAVAASVAEQVGSTFAEADGECSGNPLMQAGTVVRVEGVPAPFAGTWVVSNARHVIDRRDGGYRTRFSATGRQNRSTLSLTSAGASQRRRRTIDGLVCGIVTNINDPTQKGRVKVTLPWLAPTYESDWAPTIQLGASKRSGALFLHEVGDQVVVGFEMGDPRRPYVIGGILSQQTNYDLGSPAVMANGSTAATVYRGFTSPAGNRLVFHDEMRPGAATAPPQVSQVTLGTKDAKLGLAIDQVAGTVTVTCDPAPPDSSSSAGNLTIKCGNTGTINIETGQGGTINIDGGSVLNLKSQTSLKVESNGVITVKGSQIKLN